MLRATLGRNECYNLIVPYSLIIRLLRMKVATCLAGSQMYYAYEIINVGHVGVYVVGM